MRKILILFIFGLLYLTAADDLNQESVAPSGPNTNSPGTQSPFNTTTSSTTTPITTTLSTTTLAPIPNTTTPASTTTSTTSTTTTTTPKPTTTTTLKPTTTSTSTTTFKPTTTSTSTTAKPTTTGSPTTTVKPTPKPDIPGKWVLNYTNTNITCLVLQADLYIELEYTDSNNTKKNLSVPIPPSADFTGDCTKVPEDLTLSFGNTNLVQFLFNKTDGKKYDLSSIIASVNVSTNQKDFNQVILVRNVSEFATPASNSYKCMKEQTLNLTLQTKNVFNITSGFLRVSSFQFQAFRNVTSTKFDAALDCASSGTPDAVPIAVGCALAVLVVIVLIGYLIGRRRSQARGYLSMFAQSKREEDYIPMKNLSCFK